jgi:hypothetical protein
VTEKILPVVRAQLRVAEGRDPEPSAGLIDSQTVKGADTVGRESRGYDAGKYDAGKKVNGRKRFIVTDTPGLLLVVVVLTAGIQNRDGAEPALLDTYLRTRVRFVFADGAFAARLLDWAQTLLATTLHIVRKPVDPRGFAVIPAPVGPRAHLRLAHRAPSVGPRLPTPAGRVRGHDPLGRDHTITRRIARGGPTTRQQRHALPAAG